MMMKMISDLVPSEHGISLMDYWSLDRSSRQSVEV